MSSTSISIVYCPFESEASAKKVISSALSARLAACGNIVSALSHYEWKGQLMAEGEFTVLFKTLPHCVPDLETLIDREHSYEIPCILHWEAVANVAYHTWVTEMVLPIKS